MVFLCLASIYRMTTPVWISKNIVPSLLDVEISMMLEKYQWNEFSHQQIQASKHPLGEKVRKKIGEEESKEAKGPSI